MHEGMLIGKEAAEKLFDEHIDHTNPPVYIFGVTHKFSELAKVAEPGEYNYKFILWLKDRALILMLDGRLGGK